MAVEGMQPLLKMGGAEQTDEHINLRVRKFLKTVLSCSCERGFE